MIVMCTKCGCSITMNVTEGPLNRCPMCGHDFTRTRVSDSTESLGNYWDNDAISVMAWLDAHTMKVEGKK